MPEIMRWMAMHKRHGIERIQVKCLAHHQWREGVERALNIALVGLKPEHMPKLSGEDTAARNDQIFQDRHLGENADVLERPRNAGFA